ncbi:GntR family transcriptional regulator [Clostridioides difficile]|uniref:GntR family transcriptional regulator n=1 Tax=Clostridioides difficile TaxID=1496 RepID=UPI00038D1CB6|nr:GntR family transcriptional regulator [Clostridioides difficile]EQH77561.1 bacterial regulatory s, gntR family protein [Clostridioides difficile DA00305]
MKIVNKSSNIPLHTQLSSIIREMIETGELKEGDAIMPERELCNIQNVSRMTVNKTIVGLVTEGLLYGYKVKGHSLQSKKRSISFQM